MKVWALASFVLAMCACSSADGETGALTLGLDVADCPPDSNIIVGTPGDDVLIGSNGPDCILGLGGNDHIDGRNGNDFLVGGEGVDDIHGGNGSDQIFGEDGDDTIAGGNARDIIEGGDGNDIIIGDNGPDEIDGGAGNDVIRPSAGGDTIEPGPGSDSCSGPSCEYPVAGACMAASDCPDPSAQSCVAGVCVYCLADEGCSDGDVCTGVETCVPVVGCQAGAPAPAGVSSGLPCVAGLGMCTRVGGLDCDGAGGMVCNAVAGTPIRTDDTDCDNLDPDCDGVVDEDFDPHPTDCGVGLCRSAGFLFCRPMGRLEDTCHEGTPSPEVCDLDDNDCNGSADDGLLDSDSDGRCDELDGCPFHAAVDTSTGDVVRGEMRCVSPDPGGDALGALTSFRIRTPFGSTTTDCMGNWQIVVPPTTPLADGPINVVFSYEANIPGPEGSNTYMRVMDASFQPWGTGPAHLGFNRDTGARLFTSSAGRRTLQTNPVIISTSECEIFRIGTEIVDDYQRLRHRNMPDIWQAMRQEAVWHDFILTFYNYLDLGSGFLDERPDRFWREQTLWHESGHLIRHVLDAGGNFFHWSDDNTTFIYGRCHNGTELNEEGFAFNEGWANYWQQARFGGRVPLAGLGALTDYCEGLAGPRGITLTAGHMDWVENMVANQLLALAACVGGGTDPASLDRGDNMLLDTLEANPGSIHSLRQFEAALCGPLGPGGCCMLDRTGPVESCPPGYHNDGRSCSREGHIILHRHF